jgi:RNA polymerase sigma-70 factor (ECF subfamily)
MTPPAAQRAGARNRHRAAASRLATLFDEHASMVLGLCRLLLRDHHEAEDAAQQTFVSAYRSLLRGTGPRDAAPWLAAIARNECRARIRKRMRAPLALEYELGEQLADPTDIVDESERRAELAALTAAIAELPSRQREAVALRDFLGLSYEEVASTLSVSVPVVESLLFRARRRLRETVRTVPRYAAGMVAIPLAIRAAVSRELPDDLDSQSTAGAAGIAGAAFAGVLAKLVSLPFAGKAATAVTVVAVATAGPQIPQLLDGEQGTSRSAVSALHDSPGLPAATVDEAPSKPAPDAAPAPAQQPEPQAAAEPVEAAPPATSGSAPAEVEADAEPAAKPAEEQQPAEQQPAEQAPPEAEDVREVVKADPVILSGELVPPPAPADPVPAPVQAESQPTPPPSAAPAEPPLVLGTGHDAPTPPAAEDTDTTEAPAAADTTAPPATDAGSEEPAAPSPASPIEPAATPAP